VPSLRRHCARSSRDRARQNEHAVEDIETAHDQSDTVAVPVETARDVPQIVSARYEIVGNSARIALSRLLVTADQTEVAPAFARLAMATADMTARLRETGSFQGEDPLAPACIERIQSGMAGIHVEIAGAQRALASTQSEIAPNQSEIAMSRAAIVSVHGHTACVQDRVARLRVQMARAQSASVALQPDVAALQTEIPGVRGEIFHHRTKMTLRQRDIATVRADSEPNRSRTTPLGAKLTAPFLTATLGRAYAPADRHLDAARNISMTVLRERHVSSTHARSISLAEEGWRMHMVRQLKQWSLEEVHSVAEHELLWHPAGASEALRIAVPALFA
jgi:hypothetical protein